VPRYIILTFGNVVAEDTLEFFVLVAIDANVKVSFKFVLVLPMTVGAADTFFNVLHFDWLVVVI
jgi:hypothetical protein